jgi:hypothetical protein
MSLHDALCHYVYWAGLMKHGADEKILIIFYFDDIPRSRSHESLNPWADGMFSITLW